MDAVAKIGSQVTVAYGREERHDLQCPECPGKMVLRNSEYGLFYGCRRYPHCTAKHGAHQSTGAPLGIPANKATREARIRAHGAFDVLWKREYMTRKDAYRWLARRFGQKEVHIGEMDYKDCERVLKFCNDYEDSLAVGR